MTKENVNNFPTEKFKLFKVSTQDEDYTEETELI